MSQQINLFNPIFLKQKKYFSALAMVQALALVLAGIAALYAFEFHQTGTLEQLLVDSDRQVQEQREQLLRMGKEFSIQGSSKQLEEDVARTEAQLQKRQALVSELATGVGGDVEGFSRYMTALARQAARGVWLTAVAIGGKSADLMIRGRVLDGEMVPVYVRALSKEPVLAGRAVSELRLSAKGPAAGAVPVPAPAPLPGAVVQPPRYIEFSLSIPLGGSEPPPMPQKGSS
jgi:hypothetical protein